MAKFTNISNGPRGLHTTGGIVMVEAGQVADVTLAENEPANDEWFKAGAHADPLDHDGDGKKGGMKGVPPKE